MTQPFVGEIRAFPWDWSVRGWALAQGQQLGIAQNQALFSLLGTTYGGNGVTTFALPDLRGRVAVGIGQLAGGSNYVWGEVTGTETVTLNVTQLPPHNHLLQATTQNGNIQYPAAAYLAQPYRPPNVGTVNAYAAPGSSPAIPLGSQIGNTGGNQAHENRQPYTCLNYSIALQGIFPSRN
jgi:microcystin-dependent protein